MKIGQHLPKLWAIIYRVVLLRSTVSSTHTALCVIQKYIRATTYQQICSRANKSSDELYHQTAITSFLITA